MLACEMLIPAAAAPASTCAAGLIVTIVEDEGASVEVDAAVVPGVAVGLGVPDVPAVLDAAPAVDGYVCAVAELMAETDMLSSG